MNWFILIVILVIIFIYNNKETLSNTKTIKTLETCDNCVIYNHRDARSKCESACNVNLPGKEAAYTGVWTEVGDGKSTCECKFEGQYKKAFVGCPSADSLNITGDCFIWNDTEANSKCQFICNKYLPKKQSNWTGQWKNTSANTTACECEYYD
jgi:hypothetical protein